MYTYYYALTPKYGARNIPSWRFFTMRTYYYILTANCFWSDVLPIPHSDAKIRCKLQSIAGIFSPSVGSPMATLHCCASAISGAMLRIPKFKIYKYVSKLPFVYFALCTFGVRPLLRSD